MPVTETVRESVVTAKPSDSAADVAEMMKRNNVGCVVIARGQEPVGIVTDRDIVVRTISDGIVPPGLTASDIMTRDIETADPDSNVFEICSKMCEAEVRRMPLVKNDRLVGIITMDDILRQMADKFQELADVVAAESPPY